MSFKPKNSNTFRKIKLVQDIIKENYEPGNQSKSRRRIFRDIISKQVPMSERTFRRYLAINLDDYKEVIQQLPIRRYESPIL
ncbi:hypothetical protein [Apibacter adventoris]|uniref:hypothetical protein n=1 Tax=Apibacter adventoris TaxID=1679466 RepID=UPI000CF6433D|nr:hypothetical protein [Apibacter adventoris]PQL95194.1 hypothetical protein C4S76_03135 [Apibacter adventoris]